MYYADEHVTGMLWGRKQDNVDLKTVTYCIPGFCDDTVIKGEWVPGNRNMKFLIHSWSNGVKREVR